MIVIDEKRFIESVRRATDYERNNGKVGTLSEKLVHRTLKYYFEPNEENHEIKVCGSIVDVKNEHGITEIQTRFFERLSSKLEKMLPEYPVNVIYPVIVEKNVHWTDPESGETSVRKSSKKGRITDVLPELYHIKEFLSCDGFMLTVVLISADEYRVLDGYGKDKKKRATKVNIIPTELVDLLSFSNLAELKTYLLNVLPDNFTAKQINLAFHLRPRQLSLALKLLINLGVIIQIGKSGNAFVYSLLRE